jgi:hypothetical protein
MVAISTGNGKMMLGRRRHRWIQVDWIPPKDWN